MQKKNYLQAFSLMEILVVMVILWIALIGISRLNFTRLTKEQFIEIETEKIKNIISEVQANAFLGKSVTSNNDVPQSWRITFTNWSLVTNYTLNGTTWIQDSHYNWSSTKDITIQSLTCMDVNYTNTGAMNSPQQIKIDWNSQVLLSCPNIWSINFKVLELQIGQGGLKKSIFINTTTGTIESN